MVVDRRRGLLGFVYSGSNCPVRRRRRRRRTVQSLGFLGLGFPV
jgi:hypothetical protein